MIMVPDWINYSMFAKAIEIAGSKKPLVRLDDLRLEALSESQVVQTMHVGSFDDEAPVLEKMHEVFIPSQGLRRVGKHHEIYLSDFRRVSPDKQRTILRQPVA